MHTPTKFDRHHVYIYVWYGLNTCRQRNKPNALYEEIAKPYRFGPVAFVLMGLICGVCIHSIIQSSTIPVAYLGFQNGAKFLMATNADTEGAKPSFSIFLRVKTIFCQWGHGPIPPRYATVINCLQYLLHGNYNYFPLSECHIQYNLVNKFNQSTAWFVDTVTMSYFTKCNTNSKLRARSN